MIIFSESRLIRTKFNRPNCRQVEGINHLWTIPTANANKLWNRNLDKITTDINHNLLFSASKFQKLKHSLMFTNCKLDKNSIRNWVTNFSKVIRFTACSKVDQVRWNHAWQKIIIEPLGKICYFSAISFISICTLLMINERKPQSIRENIF